MGKTITVYGADEFRAVQKSDPVAPRTVILEGPEEMDANDGYHTFSELYEHRITLFIALCRTLEIRDAEQNEGHRPVWRSKLHSDGSSFDGWFVLGIGKEAGKQITYHLPLSRWDETEFAETLDKAPDWDGHTAGEVLKRIAAL